MARPACARIDLGAIRHNYRLAKQLSGTRAAAIIKANAYGHGMLRVAPYLAGADALAVEGPDGCDGPLARVGG